MLKKLSSIITRLLVVCVCLACAAMCAVAQSQATTGNIEGRVLDPQQAVVPGATVTAVNNQTGLEKTATTDSDGNYRIILLPPDTYTVRVATTGFAPAEVSDVVVTVGGKTPLEVGLSVSGASESVTVTGETPVVETTRTSVSTVVNQQAIENLPVNGRNYLDFATLTPGVIRDPTRGGDLSVGGQKGTLNSLQVDGTDNNNTFFGQSLGRTGTRPPYQFSEESVQEFQVNQNGFSAEFGRAGGAVINVVTRSGTNVFHGGLFEYFRDEALNANASNIKTATTPTGAPRPNVRPPSQFNQFGGRLGGPIKRNRAFFFFTYDGQRSNIPNVLEADNVNTIPTTGLGPSLLTKLNPYSVNRDQDVFMVKTDISLDRDNQLSVRFNHQNFTGVNNENGGPLSVEEHSGNSLARTTTLSGTLATTLSPALLNEFRFQFARDKEPGEANSDAPEALIGTGVGTRRLSIGRNNFSPRETTINRVQLINNVTYVTGRHALKAGVDVNLDNILNFFPGVFGGQYTFNSYADFAANRPARFQQNFGGQGTSGATTRPNSSEYAFYVQDDWRVTPKFTLNLGVRYDYQALEKAPVRNPDPALLNAGLDTSFTPQDKNNFGPRAGFSYALNERTVVRGGYGVFYGRTAAIMLGTAHSQNGISVTGVNLTCTTSPATNRCPIYPNVFNAPPVGAAPVTPSLYLFARGYTQPYVQQGRLGFEREILPNTSLSLTYMYFRGVHLSRTRDINLGPAVRTNATLNGQTFTIARFPAARPLAGYARINLFESSGNSVYNGLAVQLTRRFTNNLQFLASYTLAKAEDDKPDQTSVVPGNAGDDAKLVQNFQNIREDFGRSDLDQRHRFVFSPIWDTGTFTRSGNAALRALLSDYNFSGIIQIQTGFPYSATVSGDPNRDGNSFNDRAPGTERNQFTTPNTFQVDARITRSIPLGENMRLRLIAEGFNIFNRSNVSGTNAGYLRSVSAANSANFTVNSDGSLSFTGLTPSFGQPRIFLTERQIQLAVKFDF